MFVRVRNKKKKYKKREIGKTFSYFLTQLFDMRSLYVFVDTLGRVCVLYITDSTPSLEKGKLQIPAALPGHN